MLWKAWTTPEKMPEAHASCRVQEEGPSSTGEAVTSKGGGSSQGQEVSEPQIRSGESIAGGPGVLPGGQGTLGDTSCG